MIEFLQSRRQLLLLIFVWVGITVYLTPLMYIVLPLSMFYFRSRDAWSDLLISVLAVLVLSDMDPGLVPFRVIKSAKYGMMIAISVIYFLDTARFTPQSNLFNFFLPFFIYAFLPLVNSSDPIEGMSKTISYALLYLVIPNYVLMVFRREGWRFFRHYFFFLVLLLVAPYFLRYIQYWWVYLAGRYHGLFGNPNGLGIFSFLNFMLFSVCLHLNSKLFSFREKVLIYGVLVWSLVVAGSRTAVVASAIFFFFGRFFALSPFLGFILFLLFAASIEYAQSNLVYIVNALGMQKFFRVETLDDGSGRYFAWAFAWEKINTEGFFLTGGGFGNDEWVMRHNYDFLRSQGHDGGVHNSYLTMWFNTGIIGIMVYFYGFFTAFITANKKAPIAFAVMFATLFSVLYESWLTGSLNPYSIVLLIILTMLTEDDIALWQSKEQERTDDGTEPLLEVPPTPRLITPAR
jgi:O-antigen ligase